MTDIDPDRTLASLVEETPAYARAFEDRGLDYCCDGERTPATADRLDRVAELTDGYAVPGDACASYRSLLDRLERLERDTHMHVHRENNVLFPRAEERLPDEPAEA